MLKIRKLSAELGYRVLLALPDKIALKVQFFQVHGFLPDLANPTTFSERIQHRKLFDRDQLLPLFADKAEMKHLVADIVGDIAFTPKTHWVGTDITAVDFNSVPRPFVVKPTHLCGYVRFFGEGDSLDVGSLADECRSWLKTQYGTHLREWLYRGIPPRILVEEMLGEGAVPPDYKLLVFGGKVEYIQVDAVSFRKSVESVL